MKWELSPILPLLLATAALSLPSSRLYRDGDGHYQAAFQAQGLPEESFLEWELPPNPNSTHHLIFNGLSGFLQRWPNTLRRNGMFDPTRSTYSRSLRRQLLRLPNVQATVLCLPPSPEVQFCTMDVVTIASRMYPNGSRLVSSMDIFSASAPALLYRCSRKETSAFCTLMGRAQRKWMTGLWNLRTSSPGGNPGRTSTLRSGNVLTLYVSGESNMAWMDSFEWSSICALSPCLSP
jgi:hypothetical protein